MRSGVYPGSFDPVTIGHVDIIERASRLFDKVIVGVLSNGSKNAMFTAPQRVEMLRKACEPYPNVVVKSFDGLLVEFLKQEKAEVVIRGLRAVTDFEYELQLANANRTLDPGMETVFLTASVQYSFISSTIVKDVLRHNGDVSHFVPASVLDLMYTYRR